MRTGFDAEVRSFHSQLREFEAACDEENKIVHEVPREQAPAIIEKLARDMKRYRALIQDRFGMDPLDPHSPMGERMVTLEDMADLALWGALLGLQRRSLEDIAKLIVDSRLGQEELDRAVCEVWMNYLRAGPLLGVLIAEGIGRAADSLFALRDANRLVGEVVAAALTGYFATKISLSKNRRLDNALKREGPGSAFDNMLEQLPPEALIVWDEKRPGQPADH